MKQLTTLNMKNMQSAPCFEWQSANKDWSAVHNE